MRTRNSALALAMAAAVALGGCGGKKSDHDQIVSIVKDYSSNPSKLCNTYATQSLIAHQFATRARCLTAAKSPFARDPNVVVNKVTVKGATAVVVDTSEAPHSKGAKALLRFVKASGSWKIDSIVPFA